MSLHRTQPYFLTYFLLFVSFAVAFCLAGLFLDQRLQYWAAALPMALLLLTYRYERHFGLNVRIFFLVLASFVTLRYWLFRLTDTICWAPPVDMFFMLALFAAETYGILIHYMGMFVNIHHERRDIIPLPEDQDLWPTVDVFIPTYDESLEVVKVTACAATMLSYPKDKFNVYILDDGGTFQKCNAPDSIKAQASCRRADELRALARELGVNYLTREQNDKAKAGNLNAALFLTVPGGMNGLHESVAACIRTKECQAASDLVLFLDCDHVPTRDFLLNTAGFFLQNPNLYLVQTPHFFINPTPAEKNLKLEGKVPSENDMFYGGVHLGLDFWNSSFFCGSAALMRRSLLMERGGLAGESITEDAEVSLLLHAKGHDSAFLLKPMVCGFSPDTFADFILQRVRWAQGMTQIMVLKNPLVMKGLHWTQRLCYFNTLFYWFFGVARIIFYLSPLLYVFFGLKIYLAQVSMFVIFGVPHLLASHLVTNYLFGKVRQPFHSELYEFIQSIFMLPAVFSVLRNPHKPSFKVTPKGKTLEEDFLSNLAFPFYIMAIPCLLAFPAAAARWALYPLERGTIVVTMCWNLFNLIIIMLALGAVWEKRQVRSHHRYRTDGAAELSYDGGESWSKGQVLDLSLTGMGMLLDRQLELSENQMVKVRAKDSYGIEYTFEAVIQRAVSPMSRPQSTMVGVQFVEQELSAFKEAVGYVFGDSHRWQAILDERTGARGRMLFSFGNLILKGFYGLSVNTQGIGNLLIRRSLKLWQNAFRKPRVPLSEKA